MIRPAFLEGITLWVTLSCYCLAQNVVPIFQLSASEAAQAHKAAQAFLDAEERAARARLNWNAFEREYQAAHPGLRNLRFTADFRIAFTLATDSALDARPIEYVELTASEQKKGQSLYDEFIDSREALQRQQTAWLDYQHELIAAHVPSRGEGVTVKLQNGKQFVIPLTWQSGVAFTPDFRFCVPR